MTPEFWAIIGIGVVVVGSHLSLHRDIGGLHRDIGGLRERMAKIEGKVDILIAMFVRPRDRQDPEAAR